MRKFDQLSGFIINYEKSLFMPLSDYLNSNTFSFKISDHLVYLGLWKVKNYIESCKHLPLTLIGQVNAIKIILQDLPIFLTYFF